MRARVTASLMLCTACYASQSTPGMPPQTEQPSPKVILIVFGGGTRASESIEDPQHRWIPRVWNELAPRGTLFRNLRVEGKIVHPACAAALLTGHEEWDDNDWSRPVDHPTLFEIYRKAHAASDTACWAFVYASILAQAGLSRAPGYGLEFGANVVEPPTIPRAAAELMEGRLREAAGIGSPEVELKAARDAARDAKISSSIELGGLRSDDARAFVMREYESWKSREGTSSHDAFLADMAISCMRQFAPDVLVVAFGEIDCAHYGSWSRYVEAIRRTDELTWRIWRASEEIPSYRGRTLMLVAPDHGRELERPGGTGFVHHSDFYTGQRIDEGCRRVWLLAVGPNVPAGAQIAEPLPARAVAATALGYLGLAPSSGVAESLWPKMREAGCSRNSAQR